MKEKLETIASVCLIVAVIIASVLVQTSFGWQAFWSYWLVALLIVASVAAKMSKEHK